MFETSETALIFFFGIFWATVLSTVPNYELFAISSLIRPETRSKAITRWLVGVLVLNVFPPGLLFAITQTNILPDQAGPKAVCCSALASLSVVSLFFVLQGLLVSGRTFFYENDEWTEVKRRLHLQADEDAKGAPSFVVAGLYIVGALLLAWLLNQIL